MKEQLITFDEIFNLIKSGKRNKGIELLYSYHYNKLYGIAFLFVKNEMDAEDIVNNAIYKLLKLEIDLFPKSHISTWLYTFVKNEALMFLRKETSAVSIDKIVTLSTEDQKIENYVNMDAYYSMTKKLSEEQKQIVTLKVIGGYTHKEIADMLGKPIGTIQWIYNTSIKKLKYILSSLIMSIITFASLFTIKLTMYLYSLYKFNTDYEDEMIKGVFFDFNIVVFAFLFLISGTILVIFLKKSEKIPTKAHKKII